jgi:valyl-tRNA synthetase
MVSVMNEDGTMSAEAGEYDGNTREECRRALVERFEKDGTLERVEPHRHAVGTCYRCHSVVEPLLSVQWFVEVKELADATLEAVDQGRTRFVPAHWEKTYRTWMENIRPWCVSRQLWWGHRIPAWYCDPCGETYVRREAPEVCEKCGGALWQDEDVLDTWFSSALWPFSTMGWPEKTDTLARFYPTTTLVTGFDIIFFWVARMMMMGLRFMGEVPFRDVYIHALVRDEEGHKMSKSKGNVIDPLIIIDRYGADAFRFTLAAFAAMGRDVRLSEKRIEGYRNFVNKLWNAARFVELKRDDRVTCEMPERPMLAASRWIRSRLAACIEDVCNALEGYRFNDAASRLYQFTWNEFCDWYIELSKVFADGDDEAASETRSMLSAVLEQLLRLMHPFTPFVTEELWQSLPPAGRTDGSIMRAAYPQAHTNWHDAAADAEVGALIEVVRAVRNVRAEMRIAPKIALDVYLAPGEAAEALREHVSLIERLARVGAVHFDSTPPEGCAMALAAGIEVSIPIAAHVDLDAETARLEKELARIDKEIGGLDRKLSNPGFLAKAPAEVVEKDRARLESTRQERETLSGSLERIARISAAGGSH